MRRTFHFSFLCSLLSASALFAGRSQWTSHGPAAEPVSAIAVAPSDPRIVYASSASELWRSADAGATWTPTALTGFQVLSAVVDRSAPDTVYVSGVPDGTSEPSEILRSADGGASWGIVFQMGGGLFDLTIPSSDPGALYTRWVYAPPFRGRAQSSIFRSDDHGATWRNLGDPAAPNGYEDNFGISSFAVDLADASEIYLSNSSGVFKSTDRGTSWKVICFGCLIDGPLVVDPSDRRVLLCGGYTGVDRSLDGGVTWAPTAMMDPTSAIIPGLRPGTMLAGTANGVFVSSDKGSTWSQLGVPLPFSVSSLALGDNVLHAGTDLGAYELTTISVNTVKEAQPAPIRGPRTR